MGNRRLSRKRLFEVEKLGQEFASSAGAAMSDQIGSQTQHRDGSQITSEITIDLGSSNGPAHSFEADLALGLSSSSGTHGSSTVVLLDTDTHGVVTDLELICVEVPTGGDPDIDLYIHTAAVNASASAAGTKAINHGDYTFVGETDTYTFAAAASAKPYIYLATGNNNNADADYTAGKFILRIYGHKVHSDL
jgi:hypothetical protein